MRPKVRIVLPLIQLAVAGALTTSNFHRPNPIANPSFRAPDWQFCAGLNAPAAIIRDWLTRNIWQWGHPQIDFVLQTALFFLLVWLLWYLVSIEIGGKGHSILTPKTRMRRISDLLLMVFGTAVGLGGLTVRHDLGVSGPYSNLVAVPYYIWGVVISVFYGHDLWASVSSSRHRR